MPSNEDQVAHVNNCREKKAKNQGDLSDVNRVDQHHHAPRDAQIPELNGNNAALQALRDLPLNQETAGEKPVGDQPEDCPKRDFTR